MSDTENTQATQGEQTTFDNELRGALFTNDKGGNPKRPDYRGRCTIEGKEYRISGWKRTARQSGQLYVSLAFTVDTQQTESDSNGTQDIPVTTDDFIR